MLSPAYSHANTRTHTISVSKYYQRQGLKNKQSKKLQFTDKYYTFLTEFRQKAANFQQQRL